LQAALTSPQIIACFRVADTDFTRHRVFSFAMLAVLIVRGHKLSMQNALNKFFSSLGQVWHVPSSSAYSQARAKLKPELFLYLNQVVQQDFYELAGQAEHVRRWRGHRLLGLDASFLNLPDTTETRAAFSVQANQHEGAECVQALASVVFDLLNDVGVSAGLGRRQAEKNFLFTEHLATTSEGDCLVMDRLYADYAVMAYLVSKKREFVVRFPRHRFTQVNAFFESREAEKVVELEVPHSSRDFVRKEALPHRIKVRLIRVMLESGEEEVLGTSLIDKPKYPRAEFKQVYGWRWNEETYFDRLKNIFELERFSGMSVSSVEQDFYGMIFLTTLESVLSKAAQEELAHESSVRETKHVAQVNRVVSYVALMDRVVELFCDHQANKAELLEELHHLFQTNPTRQRVGREHERPKRSYARKLWFYRYVKRVIA
jgi:hypothetical protein